MSLKAIPLTVRWYDPNTQANNQAQSLISVLSVKSGGTVEEYARGRSVRIEGEGVQFENGHERVSQLIIELPTFLGSSHTTNCYIKKGAQFAFTVSLINDENGSSIGLPINLVVDKSRQVEEFVLDFGLKDQSPQPICPFLTVEYQGGKTVTIGSTIEGNERRTSACPCTIS